MDNVIAVWESMEWVQTLMLDSFFIKINFEKDYDRVEWFFHNFHE